MMPHKNNEQKHQAERSSMIGQVNSSNKTNSGTSKSVFPGILPANNLPRAESRLFTTDMKIDTQYESFWDKQKKATKSVTSHYQANNVEPVVFPGYSPARRLQIKNRYVQPSNTTIPMIQGTQNKSSKSILLKNESNLNRPGTSGILNSKDFEVNNKCVLSLNSNDLTSNILNTGDGKNLKSKIRHVSRPTSILKPPVFVHKSVEIIDLTKDGRKPQQSSSKASGLRAAKKPLIDLTKQNGPANKILKISTGTINIPSATETSFRNLLNQDTNTPFAELSPFVFKQRDIIYGLQFDCERNIESQKEGNLQQFYFYISHSRQFNSFHSIFN